MCAGVASLLPAVRAAEGDGFAAQGAVLLVVLLAVDGGRRRARRRGAPARRRTAPRRWPRSPRLVARPRLVVAAASSPLAPFAAAAVDRGDRPQDPAFGATAARFADVGSRRFDYWEAALKGFADDAARRATAPAATRRSG